VPGQVEVVREHRVDRARHVVALHVVHPHRCAVPAHRPQGVPQAVRARIQAGWEIVLSVDSPQTLLSMRQALVRLSLPQEKAVFLLGEARATLDSETLTRLGVSIALYEGKAPAQSSAALWYIRVVGNMSTEALVQYEQNLGSGDAVIFEIGERAHEDRYESINLIALLDLVRADEKTQKARMQPLEQAWAQYQQRAEVLRMKVAQLEAREAQLEAQLDAVQARIMDVSVQQER